MQTSLGTAQVTEAPDKQHSDILAAQACEPCGENSLSALLGYNTLPLLGPRGNGGIVQ